MLKIVPCLIVACAYGQVPYATSIKPSVDAHEIAANRGASALWQSLKKLDTRASLIMFTAHPDDEDGGMLAYESRGQGVRVALLTLNRGEGGANVMSSDYFDALGLVRTMELLAAGRYYGVDQYWTRVVDYGFSKTKAESIGKWTHDRVLYDAVRVVRMVRPLVITSVFVGGPSDGHGNHQTAGAMAQEAFKAAGDPNMFPDQIKAGLQPWTPIKVYARQPFSRRGGGDGTSVNVQIPEGTYDPLLGVSFLQLAREGLGYQKSQNGGGSIPKDGQMLSNYHRFGSVIPAKDQEESFFDGINISLAGIVPEGAGTEAAFLRSGLEKIHADVQKAISAFSATEPDRSAPALAAGLKETIALLGAIDSSRLTESQKSDVRHELEIKRVQFNNALTEALDLSVSATVTTRTEPNAMMAMFMGDPETFRTAIPGQRFPVRVHVNNASKTPVELVKASVESYGQKTPWQASPSSQVKSETLGNNKPVEHRFEVTVPEDAQFTKPYFARPHIEQSYYDVLDQRYLNQPLPAYPLCAWADFQYEGVPVRVGEYVQTVQRVTGQGSVLEPLTVAPAVGVSISPRTGIVPLGSKSFPVAAVVHSNVKGPAKGTLKLELPEGWTAEPRSSEFSIADDGQHQALNFSVTPSALNPQKYQVKAVAEYQGKQYNEGYQVTGYPGLRPYFLYTAANYQTTGVDVKVAPDLKVAYIMGSGDDVPASLTHLGVNVSFLGQSDLATGDLSKYDAILLGVRTYAARDDLRVYNNRLLDYVKNGGVVIVQYNTPEFDHNYGPYPYTMTSNPEEVTDEASNIQILQPQNPVFTWPNKITEKDFTGWVEERGSKWMQSWDPQYTALLETHDEGQAPQKGGLLYAKYGKGIYIYNAYAFYRQLPEGVAGAYRIFANMISLSKNPEIRR
ncbi:MAG: PIG-L family deacetylase [Bryobacteraceae bacterium]